MAENQFVEKMLNPVQTNETTAKDTADPLPWLIHSLRGKRAVQADYGQAKQATEPQKESM